MFTECSILCCVCGKPIDWHKRYGRDAPTCGKACWNEFEWRRTLSTLGEEYYPDPRGDR